MNLDSECVQVQITRHLLRGGGEESGNYITTYYKSDTYVSAKTLEQLLRNGIPWQEARLVL